MPVGQRVTYPDVSRVVELGVAALVILFLGTGLISVVGRTLVPEAATVAADRGASVAWLTVAAYCLLVSAWVPLWYFLGPLAATRADLAS